VTPITSRVHCQEGEFLNGRISISCTDIIYILCLRHQKPFSEKMDFVYLPGNPIEKYENP